MFPPRRGSTTSDSSSMSSSSSEYSKASVPISVPSLEDSRFDTPAESFFDSPRESADTYCTTLASFDDEEEEDDEVYDSFYCGIPEAVPATPQEFAELFPTTERLSIKHDDSTLDGNMNLRVDCGPRSRRITLFHLRMYDLRDRDFSVRRYGRDCGREVAHVKRKCTAARPALQRKVSKALQSFRGEPKRVLDRVDSGYKSADEEDLEDDGNTTSTKSTNTCVLEFSNYAHVDLSRRGNRASKKYDFEYWGKSYSWRRTLLSEEAAYNLVNNATGNVIATIRPDPLTPAMAAAEEAKGGFVPPCTMQIRHSAADPVTSANADVADVIMTTGLVMLVDDCIKRKYHTKKTVQLVLPTTGFKMDMEYLGPKRFLGEMFNRSRPSTPSPPRRAYTA